MESTTSSADWTEIFPVDWADPELHLFDGDPESGARYLDLGSRAVFLDDVVGAPDAERAAAWARVREEEHRAGVRARSPYRADRRPKAPRGAPAGRGRQQARARAPRAPARRSAPAASARAGAEDGAALGDDDPPGPAGGLPRATRGAAPDTVVLGVERVAGPVADEILDALATLLVADLAHQGESR